MKCINHKNLPIYEYVHAIIQRREKLNNKFNLKQENIQNDRLNVMIIIFDSVSASSFKRALPHTFNFLQTFENNFMFEKHHIIGKNTFPNLIPMLANIDAKLLLNLNDSPLDSVPFIWKNFSER